MTDTDKQEQIVQTEDFIMVANVLGYISALMSSQIDRDNEVEEGTFREFIKDKGGKLEINIECGFDEEADEINFNLTHS